MRDEQRDFWSKVARNYDRVVDLQIGAGGRSLVRERLSREARLGSLVEFGCGTGYYTDVLASHSDSVVATDLSPGMLELARDRIKAANVSFQIEDVQRTSFPDGVFDTVFMSLLIHFTEPQKALSEVRRILKPGGRLIISNLDPDSLGRWDRTRCTLRMLYHGATGYRLKPPKGFGENILSERELCGLLGKLGFEVVGTETLKDTSRSSNIPLEYIKAVRT
jgi:ubiquinone/menaquinone biosynthesis C-methylase UbiE